MQKKSFEIGDSPSQLITSFLSGRNYSQLGVLVDDNTFKNCYPLLKSALPAHKIIKVSSGEEFKNLNTCTSVWEQLTNLQFDRHSLLIILGGGVLGDLGGFCAATYKRGIDFVLMPTTLLAQVDASIGGKLGIDFKLYKNHIGVFCEPVATLISPAFLNTLPKRELRSGFTEVIKHCLLSDEAMWDTIRMKRLEDQDWGVLIKHSAKFKESVIREDPKEKGLRKILNLGHTLGHGLESHFLGTPKRLFHGEAIAMGLILESHIAFQKGMLRNDSLKEIRDYFLSVFSPFPELPPVEVILNLIRQDKKNKGDVILLALLQGIGKAKWDVEVSEKEIRDSFQFWNTH